MSHSTSNTAAGDCLPTPSSCVIWQGPDLPCISLCKGDKITEVVYKLAVELCTLQQRLDLSTLDLSRLVQVCQNTPAPQKTLAAVLELLIAKVVCLSDIVRNLPTAQPPYAEPVLDLEACIRFTQNAQQVTRLKLSDYTVRIAQRVCELNSSVTTLNSRTADLETRLATLEARPATGGATLPMVTPVCVLPAQPQSMQNVLVALEDQFCQLRNAIGGITGISRVAAAQCTNLSQLSRLSGPGVMSTLSGWTVTPQTLSQSLVNLWLTVCDMRDAFISLRESVSGSAQPAVCNPPVVTSATLQ